MTQNIVGDRYVVIVGIVQDVDDSCPTSPGLQSYNDTLDHITTFFSNNILPIQLRNRYRCQCTIRQLFEWVWSKQRNLGIVIKALVIPGSVHQSIFSLHFVLTAVSCHAILHQIAIILSLLNTTPASHHNITYPYYFVTLGLFRNED